MLSSNAASRKALRRCVSAAASSGATVVGVDGATVPTGAVVQAAVERRSRARADFSVNVRFLDRESGKGVL